jgi:hypothetical protein
MPNSLYAAFALRESLQIRRVVPGLYGALGGEIDRSHRFRPVPASVPVGNLLQEAGQVCGPAVIGSVGVKANLVSRFLNRSPERIER